MELRGHNRLSAPQTAGTGSWKIDARFILTARCGAYALMGLIMSCTRVMENGAPFGMAMVACAGAGLSGVFTLAGAALGYLISGGMEWGIRYIAAAVLVYTIAFVFHELDIYKSSLFMPSAAAFVMGLTGFLGSFSIAGTLPVVAELFVEVCLAFGGTYFFSEALSAETRTTESAELRHAAAIVIMAACFLIAFSRIVVFNMISLGRTLALILVMASAMKGGILTGAAVGTVLGIAMDISGTGYPCAKCRHKNRCWNADYIDTLALIIPHKRLFRLILIAFLLFSSH